MMIETVTRGQIYINNRNLSRLPKRQIPYLRPRIGMTFQNPQLLYYCTVFDNVAIPLLISSYRHSEIKRRAHAVLDKVGFIKKRKITPFLYLAVNSSASVSRAQLLINRY